MGLLTIMVGRRSRAADRVRERRQPHARARRHTPAGAGASRRARRRTASSGAAAPHRERRDRRSRRGARPARRTLDRISARRGGGRSISCSRDRECADRWHGAALHNLCLGRSRSWVRCRAGVRMPFEGSERAPARGVPIGDRSSCATRAAGTGDRGNSARAGAARRRWNIDQDVSQTASHTAGIQQRQLDQGGSLAAAAQASGNSTRAWGSIKPRSNACVRSQAFAPRRSSAFCRSITATTRNRFTSSANPIQAQLADSTPSSTWRRPATSG